MGLKILNEVKVFEMSDVCNVPNKYLIELIVWHVKQKFLPTVYPQPTWYKPNIIKITLGTSEEKHAVSRAKSKAANKEKVTKASRISNFRAQAKKIPKIMNLGMEAVYKWVEEKEKKWKA